MRVMFFRYSVKQQPRRSYPTPQHQNCKSKLDWDLALYGNVSGFKAQKRNTFASVGSKNFQSSMLVRHQGGDTPDSSNDHAKLLSLTNVFHGKSQNATGAKTSRPTNPLQAAVQKGQLREATKQNEGLLTAFHTVFHLSSSENHYPTMRMRSGESLHCY